MHTIAPPVPQGPRAYRRHIRWAGPLLALAPPAILGALALMMVRGSVQSTRGVPAFGLALLAAPTLLVLGVPMRSGTSTYMVAAASSAVMWLAIGVVASARATRRPAATWRDFWREFAWLAGGVWLGVLMAGIAADLLLGRPFL